MYTEETVDSSDLTSSRTRRHLAIPTRRTNHGRLSRTNLNGPEALADDPHRRPSLHVAAPDSPTDRRSDWPTRLLPLLLKSYRTVDLGGGAGCDDPFSDPYTASLTLLSVSAIILPILTHLTIHAYSSLHLVRTIATY